MQRQPLSQYVIEREPFALSVCSSGSPVSCQWYFNGIRLSGATSNVYSHAATGLSGAYYALQYKTNLDPRLPWLTVSNQANPFTVPSANAAGFYRLFNFK